MMDREIITSELYAIIAAYGKSGDNGMRYNARKTMNAVHDIMSYLRATFKAEQCGNFTLTDSDKGYNRAIDRIADALNITTSADEKDDG